MAAKLDNAPVAVDFREVDVVFGDRAEEALGLMDRGASRDDINAETGAVVAVRGATMSVRRGELCVLMGLSGSGKSSLLRCVNRLNHVSRGRLFVNEADGRGGIDVTSCDAGELRRLRTHRIAMVFQQFGLLPWRTVAENVAFGLELQGTPKARRRRVVDEKLKLVGLERWADRYAAELSGGMQQRVGLARAFATDADILLMDEPYSALDPLIRSHLQDSLLELQHELQKTIIFVSHDLDEALKLGDHIAIMRDGAIVQYGTPQDIVLNPADDYVTAFVQHVNPLNVLCGDALMRPLEDLAPAPAGGVALDPLARLAARRNGDGRFAVTCDGRAVTPRPVTEALTPADVACEDVLAAPLTIPLRRAIEFRHRSDWPLLLVEDGHLVGIVDDADIYRAIMGRRG
ncbi:MAG: choline ABC transporter ATP-binding protein [Rhodospirillaceae bacterium]|nr:choline ABC transporter ATP-binding protein [Rhodospirillaceae bacterium]